MVFENIKEEATRKFCELKLWITNIEDADPYSTIARGLFFVYIYGIYEEIIRQVVSQTIDDLNGAHITIEQCIFELYALAFSTEYDGLYNVGNEHKWERRWDISKKFIENEYIIISHEIIPTDGKNIRYKQLDSIAKSFGMKQNILPRNEIGGYIQEMVNNRNYIAHGNKLPREVGRDYTNDDLLLRCNYISEICTHTIDIYEAYINERQYLREENL